MQTILWLISRCTNSTTQHSSGNILEILGRFLHRFEQYQSNTTMLLLSWLSWYLFQICSDPFSIVSTYFLQKTVAFEGTNVGIVFQYKPSNTKCSPRANLDPTAKHHPRGHDSPRFPTSACHGDTVGWISRTWFQKEMLPHHPTNLHQERNLKCSTCEIWSTSDQLIFWVGNIHGSEIKLTEIPGGPAITRFPTKNY